SLLICQRQLARYRKRGDGANPYLVAVVPEGAPGRYDATTPAAKIDQAAKKGLAWLGKNFALGNTPIAGLSVYYGMYGIERVAARADKDMLGKIDWFRQGRDYLLKSQRPDGQWDTH